MNWIPTRDPTAVKLKKPERWKGSPLAFDSNLFLGGYPEHESKFAQSHPFLNTCQSFVSWVLSCLKIRFEPPGESLGLLRQNFEQCDYFS